MLKLIVTLTIALFIALCANAQYMQLEKEVPTNWKTTKGAKLSMSDLHYKLGKESVRWDWKKGSEILVTKPKGMLEALKTSKGGLMLWIYNESPLDDVIQFQFGTANQIEYHFEYKINFKGWRACWIQFDKDMQGSKSTKNLSWMKVLAPVKAKKGQLYFDRMMFPKKGISRKQTPDAQLPYVNPKLNENHWGALYFWESTLQNDIALQSILSPSDKAGLEQLDVNFIAAYKGSPLDKKAEKKVKDKFRKFGIHRLKSGIVGNPFVSKDEAVKKSQDLTLEKVEKVFYSLAQHYYNTKDEESKSMFLDLLDHLMDQGLAYGSAIGTNHHYGYQFRKYPPAIFLMKEVLKEEGKLNEVAKMLNYWTGVQEYRELPVSGTLQGVMDSWNTTVIPRMLAILCIDNPSEQLREMQAVKRWMDISLKIVPGTMGGIKADGCGFHHGGLYPAYCNGGFAGLGDYLKMTTNTPFALSAESRTNVGMALRTMKNYTHDLEWGFGISGRHPLDGTMSLGLKQAYAYLALSGDPYTGDEIWNEMAEAYLRMETDDSEFKKLFESKGLSPELVPEGHFTYNYGALGIHRRNNWMATIKGYNKHVWGSEIYTRDNRYGRYQSYGTVQIMHKNTKESGFVEAGWDWNSYPGATNIHLPLDLLESPNKNTLMEKSKQGFAGSSHLNGENGVFGIHLKENNRERFTANFHALKSVFAFDNVLICLGSNISNSNEDYPSKTSLFQSFLTSSDKPQWIDGDKKWTEFPAQKDLSEGKNHSLMDPYGNAYWIAGGNSIQLKRIEQNSRHNKTKKPTHGKFALAHINHGFAPKNADYEYAILPQTSLKDLVAFSKAMTNEKTARYQVIQKDSIAHIVHHKGSNTKAYVVFESADELHDENLISVSSPSLIMLKGMANKSLRMSLCDPDLHLSEERYTTAEASTPIKIQVKLVGEWNLSMAQSNCQILQCSNGFTSIEFTCVDGIPIEVNLEKY
ncbi:chondroitinase family polysaccharide lyase [Ancylomarina sp. YFZ004]